MKLKPQFLAMFAALCLFLGLLPSRYIGLGPPAVVTFIIRLAGATAAALAGWNWLIGEMGSWNQIWETFPKPVWTIGFITFSLVVPAILFSIFRIE